MRKKQKKEDVPTVYKRVILLRNLFLTLLESRKKKRRRFGASPNPKDLLLLLLQRRFTAMTEKKNTVSEEVIASAKDRLMELSSDFDKNEDCGVTRGETWAVTGKYYNGKGYTQCHAWVSSAFRGFNSEFLTLSCHSKKRTVCSEEAHDAIVRWMVSDQSPFAKYILNRDDDKSLTEGGVVILCGGSDGASLNEALWMCKVLRYGVEAGKSLDVWLDLVREGVNPLFALFIASFVRDKTKQSFKFSGPEGHSAVFGKCGWSYVYGRYSIKPLFNPVVNRKAGQTSEVLLDVEHEEGTKGDRLPTSSYSEKIEGFCKPIKISDGWGSTVDGQAASRLDFISSVLEWQRELCPDYTPDNLSFLKPINTTGEK